VSWQTLLAIGSGGFIGAILRAYITSIVNKNLPHDLPFGTLSVNLLGSFILGILFAYFYTANISIYLKSFLTTGMMGALTTYSTFAMETFFLLNTNIYLALSNMALNLFGTVIMAGTGFKVASLFFGK
jgi:CrcB protein